MDIAVARWLVSGQAAGFLALARGLADPSSLGSGTSMRAHLSPERAAAVLDLEVRRRRGEGKLGALYNRLFLTQDGLEQATRWEVARWRAQGIGRSGTEEIGQVEQVVPTGQTGLAGRGPIRRVIDAGCGLGIDSLACLEAGLSVIAIERDPVLATFAAANLGQSDSPSPRPITNSPEANRTPPQGDANPTADNRPPTRNPSLRPNPRLSARR